MSEQIDWAAIAAQLQAPFAASEVKQKKGRGGKQLSYIDARAVAARLDAVVGAGNWSFDWQPMVIQRPERGVVWEDQGWENGVKLPPIKKPAPEPEVDAVCVAKGILTIYGVSKADIGYAGPIEPNKASISNALRRCAALWGIGRYLYDQEAPARSTAQNGAQRPAQAQTAIRRESSAPSNGAAASKPSAPATAPSSGIVANDLTPAQKARQAFKELCAQYGAQPTVTQVKGLLLQRQTTPDTASADDWQWAMDRLNEGWPESAATA